MQARYSKRSAGPSTRRAMLGPEQVKDLTYYSLTKAELQDEASKRGLPKSGTKDDLIQRLQEND